MIYLVYALHILVCVFLILVVLLQQGKGADLSVFGGGSTQTAFGARGATTFLHKLTVVSFVVFVLTTLWLGLPRLGGGGSVLHGAATGSADKSGKDAAKGSAKPAPLNRPAAAVPVNPAPAQKLPSAATAPPLPATAAPQSTAPTAPSAPSGPSTPAAKPVAGGSGSAPKAPPSQSPPPSSPPH